MRPVFTAMIAIVCFGCGGSIPDEQEYIETEVPIYQEGEPLDCNAYAYAHVCDDRGDPCDDHMGACDFSGKPGVCVVCCDGNRDVLRCHPVR
jgi:hypothetical protein